MTEAEKTLSARLTAYATSQVEMTDDLIPAADVDELEDGEFVPFLDDAAALLRYGSFADGTQAELREMAACECHRNSAELFFQHADDDDLSARLRLMTGYALSADGIWRRHSWLTKSNGQIVETTAPRRAYYGLMLSSAEDGSPAPQGSAWDFHALHTA